MRGKEDKEERNICHIYSASYGATHIYIVFLMKNVFTLLSLWRTHHLLIKQDTSDTADWILIRLGRNMQLITLFCGFQIDTDWPSQERYNHM